MQLALSKLRNGCSRMKLQTAAKCARNNEKKSVE